MDAETREQLKTNELAHSLVAAKEWFDKYGNWILGTIAALALGFAGYRLWSWRHESALEKGWSELLLVQTNGPATDSAPADQLRRIIGESPDASLRTAARVRLANMLATRAVESGEASQLEGAISEFKAIVDSPDSSNLFRAAAQFRLGSLYETKRDFSSAKAAFQTVTSDARYADSPFVVIAKERIESMSSIEPPVTFTAGGPPPPASAPVIAPLPEGALPAPVAAPAPAPIPAPAEAPPATQPASAQP